MIRCPRTPNAVAEQVNSQAIGRKKGKGNHRGTGPNFEAGRNDAIPDVVGDADADDFNPKIRD